MESSASLNEEELLSDQLEKAVVDYNKFLSGQEKRQNLLQVLQSNDFLKIITKSVGGNNFANSFVFASCWNHPDILQAFLNQGINIDVKDRNGWTALISASQHGHKQIVQLLLNHNADTDLKNNHGDAALDVTDDEDIKEMIQNHVNTSYVLK